MGRGGRPRSAPSAAVRHRQRCTPVRVRVRRLRPGSAGRAPAAAGGGGRVAHRARDVAVHRPTRRGRAGRGQSRPAQVREAVEQPQRVRPGAAVVAAGGGDHPGARRTHLAGPPPGHPAPRAALPRVRDHPGDVVRQDQATQTRPVHAAGPTDRDPPDADRPTGDGPQCARRATAVRAGPHRRQAGRRARTAPPGAADRLATDVPRLRTELAAARDATSLPDRPDPAAVDALHDLVVRTRLG